MNRTLKLGVNIDHVATVRQARLASQPSPLEAAQICMAAGADGITAHLREDRRHIQDADVIALSQAGLRLNMEMALTEEMVRIASTLVRPQSCCLVPEKRQELTTEGGLDAVASLDKLMRWVPVLKNAGIAVSLFIAPDFAQIDCARQCGAEFVELHTGSFANAVSASDQAAELDRLAKGAEYAHSLGIGVNAGHGIDYENIKPLLAAVPHLHELNIGHSIIARAIMKGVGAAVADMLDLMQDYKGE